MQRIRWYGPTVILLLTTLMVMIAGPRLARQIAWARMDTRIELVRDSLSHNPSLAELSDAFRRVAEVVEPSVVHIQVSTKQASGAGRRGMEDQLLRRFFGPHFFRGDEPGLDKPEPKKDEGLDRYNVPRVKGNGSGWVYDQDGHVITNYHVVENADVIQVRFQDGSERKAKVVGTDPKTDIAVIQIEGGDLHPAELATEPVEQGDIVFAFGSPFRFEFSMSQGIVSGKGRRLGILDRRQGYENFIQTDAAINPGNSGGPLTNIYGQVVGMNTAIATRTGASNGLGFAIPVAMVQSVVEQLIDTGKVSRGYLGIFIKDLDPKLAKTFGYDGEGVLVENPIEGSPAQKAGIQRGDIITHLDGEPVSEADQLRNLVAGQSPGQTLKVKVFRGGQTLDFEVAIGELPDQVAMAGMVDPAEGSSNDLDDSGTRTLRKLGLERVATLTEPITERLGIPFEPGVIIRSVRPDSVAAAAGLASRHVITHVMGQKIADIEGLVRELEKYDLTQGVRLSVLDGEVMRFVLLELPEE